MKEVDDSDFPEKIYPIYCMINTIRGDLKISVDGRMMKVYFRSSCTEENQNKYFDDCCGWNGIISCYWYQQHFFINRSNEFKNDEEKDIYEFICSSLESCIN